MSDGKLTTLPDVTYLFVAAVHGVRRWWSVGKVGELRWVGSYTWIVVAANAVVWYIKIRSTWNTCPHPRVNLMRSISIGSVKAEIVHNLARQPIRFAAMAGKFLDLQPWRQAGTIKKNQEKKEKDLLHFA
nr:hypothetical protein [Tanacetum cinerariifolium]